MLSQSGSHFCHERSLVHCLYHGDSRSLKTVDAHDKPKLRHLCRLIFEFTCKVHLDKTQVRVCLLTQRTLLCVRGFCGRADKSDLTAGLTGLQREVQLGNALKEESNSRYAAECLTL